MLLGGSAIAYAATHEAEPTQCVQQTGGPGLCVRNESEGGWKCVSRDYLGDCNSTVVAEVE